MFRTENYLAGFIHIRNDRKGEHITWQVGYGINPAETVEDAKKAIVGKMRALLNEAGV